MKANNDGSMSVLWLFFLIVISALSITLVYNYALQFTSFAVRQITVQQNKLYALAGCKFIYKVANMYGNGYVHYPYQAPFLYNETVQLDIDGNGITDKTVSIAIERPTATRYNVKSTCGETTVQIDFDGSYILSSTY